jgi:MOSC domain-containing protein YiiM
MHVEVARMIRVSAEQPLHTPGDNVLVDIDLSEDALPIGTRLRLGQALLEVSPEPHTGCDRFSARFGAPALAWINHKARRARRLRGVNCRVVEAGQVALGDAVVVER